MIKHRGDSIGFKAIFTDKDGGLINPDHHLIKIFNPSGVQVGEDIDDPAQLSLGVYEYDYSIPADAPYGDWTVTWYADKGSFKEREVIFFTVKELLGDT